MRSSRRRISFGRCWNFAMSMWLVASFAPARSNEATDDHGRTIGRDDEPGDRRITIADRDDEVGHLADRLAVAVEHGSPDRLAEKEHVPPPAEGWWVLGGRRQVVAPWRSEVDGVWPVRGHGRRATRAGGPPRSVRMATGPYNPHTESPT
jgi:hypothetical protein